jgi:glycosyltransferase involved in cell wall biosynthesis
LVEAALDLTSATMLRTFQRPPGGVASPDAFTVEQVHALRANELLRGRELDIVHDHTAAAPLAARVRDVPTIVTAHSAVQGRLVQLYEAAGLPMVAVSADQRDRAPQLPWIATVHNAIEVDTYPFQAEKEGFALFLGRIHPDKGVHLAIEAAGASGIPLVLAGKCSETVEREYFDDVISPMLGTSASYVGVLDQERKRDLLRRASMLLFPIQWEEPFGLVMVEAMACGTPVVATRRGAVPEVVTDGVTGVIVDDPAELPDAMGAAREIDPHKCRDDAEQRFDVPLMVTRYEAAFLAVLGDRPDEGFDPAPT